MLEEIFPNIAARPRGGYKRGAFPGLPKIPGLFTQREREVKTDCQLPTLCSPVISVAGTLRGLWWIVLRPGFPETDGNRGCCGVAAMRRNR
jgi:hypothetical protein